MPRRSQNATSASAAPITNGTRHAHASSALSVNTARISNSVRLASNWPPTSDTY